MTSEKLQEIERAHQLLKEYDGSTMNAVAELWAEEHLDMKKAKKGSKGIDGTLPNGRTLQVKSKKAGAHSDSGTYITLSKSSLELADDLLIVFVDYDTCRVTRTIGPVPVAKVKHVGREGSNETRYHVSDILGINPATNLGSH